MEAQELQLHQALIRLVAAVPVSAEQLERVRLAGLGLEPLSTSARPLAPEFLMGGLTAHLGSVASPPEQ